MLPSQKTKIKAVGLISGGLDSTLAAKIIKDLGVDVYGIYFAMPWGCGDELLALEIAEEIGIPLITMKLDESYLDVIRNPKYGYGTAMNPCIDCHAHMLSRAAAYMKRIGADFLFTGEVLGQRPMSQKRHSMKRVETEAGLEGLLLRPLSAQHLKPTIPEQQGWIDRRKLLNITGRSRKPQIQLAADLKITKYKQPAGGCLLTDKNFAKRMRDLLDHGYRSFEEIAVLQWGRHFRINERFKAIVGRDERENNSLLAHAHPDDQILLFAEADKPGPTLVLKGYHPSEEILSAAAGLVQRFSKYKNNSPMTVQYWTVSRPDQVQLVTARKLDPSRIAEMYL